jgi:hypothetical protein
MILAAAVCLAWRAAFPDIKHVVCAPALLRRKLRQLEWRDFHLDVTGPFVNVRASISMSSVPSAAWQYPFASGLRGTPFVFSITAQRLGSTEKKMVDPVKLPAGSEKLNSTLALLLIG